MSKTTIGIIIIVIIVVSGYGIFRLLTPKSAPTALNKIAFSSLIRGCAETDKGMATRSSGEGTEQEPKIEINGNQIKYSRAINHMCCRKAEIQNEIINSTINIFENWSGIGCRCMCFSEIEAAVNDVPPGSYIVNVYEKGIQPGDNNRPMEQKLIITQEAGVR
jgi:hypothetical protein